jgi:hypothetical protein
MIIGVDIGMGIDMAYVELPIAMCRMPQGVRSTFLNLHKNTTGVRFKIGMWTADDLRNATFCLAPSGWGYGWRTYLALAMLCIPVIIQRASRLNRTALEACDCIRV